MLNPALFVVHKRNVTAVYGSVLTLMSYSFSTKSFICSKRCSMWAWNGCRLTGAFLRWMSRAVCSSTSCNTSTVYTPHIQSTNKYSKHTPTNTVYTPTCRVYTPASTAYTYKYSMCTEVYHTHPQVQLHTPTNTIYTSIGTVYTPTSTVYACTLKL